MPGPFEAAGAVRGPTRFSALSMGARQFTGLVTQRSPYRDGAVPYLVGKFYGGTRFDSIWDGLNREITQKLTDARAPGSSIYNSLNFPAINSFYPWKYIQNGVEVVRVLADGSDGVVYDATTGQKSTLFTKSSGAGRTRFLGLNTQLYLYNGIDTKKALEGGITWQPTTNVLPGTLINVGATPGVMFMALGGITLPIVATSVTGSGSTWHHLVYVDPTQVPENFANLVGVEVTFSGLTTDTTLNGQTLPVDTVLSTTLGILQVTTTTGSVQAYTVDTGDGTTGNGTTGGSAPAFNATRLSITADAGQQWKSYGTAVQNVGLKKPTVPPTIAPVSPTRFWQPNTQFPVYTSLLDSNGNIEVVASISGTNASGQTYPTWAAAPNPAQLVATNLAGIPAATANVFGTIYQNTSGNTEYHQGWGNVVSGGLIAYYELTIGPTNPPTENTWGTTFTATDKAGTGSNGKLGFDFQVPPGWFYKLEAFGDVSPTPGSWDATPLAPVTTGVSTPGGANAVTVDGGLTWYNLGQPGAWQADTANAGVPGACLIDSNGNLQWLFDGAGGTSGLTAPTWGTTLGATTTDGGLTWVCISTGGSGASLTYQTLQWAYSLHGIDGSVSTASPVSIVFGGILGKPMTPNQLLTLTASSPGMFSDTQIDQVWIWRTTQGNPTLILEDQIPADGLTNSFTYTERDIPDTSANGGAALNPFIPAPVADSNDPPSSNMTAPVYYLQRVWGIVDNTVVYSGGPDTITGNGNTAFPPLNEIPFAAQPIRLLPVLVQNGGLLVMTTSGIKIILGTGTPSNPFYVGDYLELVSILNYDAVSVFYNQIFCMESNGKVSSLAIEYPFNPQTGYTEVGFPIGDQFVKTTTGGQNSALFNPATAYVSWNAHSSADTGMYVSSGTGFWFRMSLINPPESGILWSPLRQFACGGSAVQSVETTPGVRNLLIGPPAGSPGPIQMRDTTGTVWTDVCNSGGTSYEFPNNSQHFFGLRSVNSAGIISTPALTSIDSVWIANGGLLDVYGMVRASDGSVFLADFGASVVWKVAPDGVTVTRIAGSGTSGYSGDGGSALAAELWQPAGLCLDAAGNLYISDVGPNATTNPQVVRVVNLQAGPITVFGQTVAAGDIQTVAGQATGGFSGDTGPATSAKLSAPYAVQIDTSGNLWICDQNNNRIRIVNPAGIINTIIGNGTAGFAGDGGAYTSGSVEINQPTDIKFDSRGVLYITDGFVNQRIRAANTSGGSLNVNGVTIAAGDLDTIAGNGSVGFAGDGASALTAEFRSPWQTTPDGLGGLYICDTGNTSGTPNTNFRIRFVTAAGIISTVVGTGGNPPAGLYTGDGGPATAAGIGYVTGLVILQARGGVTSVPYDAWDAKGVTLLASTGQWSNIKHISAKSKNTGGPRPVVSALFDEIEPSAERPYIDMELVGKGNDPPRNRESLSVYSDRYRLAQQGQETTGDCILVKFDYGTVAFGDELLEWGIYGAVHEEDEEQAAKP